MVTSEYSYLMVSPIQVGSLLTGISRLWMRAKFLAICSLYTCTHTVQYTALVISCALQYTHTENIYDDKGSAAAPLDTKYEEMSRNE